MRRRSLGSPTLIERVRHVIQPCSEGSKRHQRVIQQIGRFLDASRSILVGASEYQLSGLLSELLESQIAIAEETLCVTPIRTVGLIPDRTECRCALTDNRIQGAQGIANGGDGAETRGRASMTGGASRNDASEDGVAVAVGRKTDDALGVAARRSFVPESTRPGTKMHLASGDRPLECLAIRMRNHEDGAGARILHDNGHRSAALREVDRVEAE